MDNKKICVLMATYNGKKYIEEQIQSILNQKDVEVYLIIRDDMSTDGTREYLKTIEKENKVKVILGDENLGPAVGFMQLLYEAPQEYDYYAFADQDDIWKENKLYKAIEKIEKYDKPALYCSNQTIFRENKIEGLRYNRNPNISLVNIIFGNHIAGCTMVMNKQLRNIISEKNRRPNNDVLRIRMHDVWVILVASAIGYVIYDENSYINYRIHNKNTVGIDNGLKRKLKIIKKKIFNDSLRNGRSKIASELLNKIDLNEKDKLVVEQIVNYRKNIRNKIKLIFSQNVYKNIDEKRFIFICKVLLNWL